MHVRMVVVETTTPWFERNQKRVRRVVAFMLVGRNHFQSDDCGYGEYKLFDNDAVTQ